VLAHDICDNARDWENFLPPNSTVIIDNSVVELGFPVAWEVMKKAYDILGPDLYRIIVLPDRPDDPQTTAFGSLEYLGRIRDKTPDCEYMYVIQGKTSKDIDRAIYLFDSLAVREDRVKWVGIPRRIQQNVGTRLPTLLKAKRLMVKIHLMGLSDLIEDDIQCTRSPDVEGIDSAVPLRLGQRDIIIDLDFKGDQAGPRNDYWSKQYTALNPQTIKNLHLIREAINVGELV
jgi:hypothetical protein